MAGAGLGRGLATALLVINFCLYLVAAILAGWALNRNFDAGIGRGEGGVGNNVTQFFFLPVTLIACMVGLASVLAGIHHLRLFRSDSLAAAAATSLIAWLLVLLAMGLACKQIHTGGNRPRRLRVVEAFMIILALYELLYLLSLHAGFGRAGNHHAGGVGAGAGTGAGIGMGGVGAGAGTGAGTGMGGVGAGAGTGAGTGMGGVGAGAGTGAGTGLGGVGAGAGTGAGTGIGGHPHQHHTDYGHHTDTKVPVGHVSNPAHPGY